MGILDRITGRKEETPKSKFLIGGPKPKTTDMIHELLEGKIIKNEIKIPKELGEEHPFNYKLTEGIYTKLGTVTGIIDKLVDFVWGPGFFTKSSNESEKKKVDEWMEKVNFSTVGRKWLREMLIKGTGYIELAGGMNEVPDAIKVLNSNHMFIKRDDFGEIEVFNQFLGKEIRNIDQEVTAFKPFEVAHITLDEVGDSPYGIGIIWPNMKTINNLLSSEKNLHLLMQRKANTPIVARMGDPVNGNLPTENDITNFSNKLQTLNNKSEWAISGDIEMSVLDFGNFGEKFTAILEHNMQQLFFGFQMPATLMGMQGVPEGLSEVQMDALQRRVRSIQVEIQTVIEDKIFTRILGEGHDVEFEWGQPSQREKNEKIAQITELLRLPFLDLNLKEELEQTLASLLGIEFEPSSITPNPPIGNPGGQPPPNPPEEPPQEPPEENPKKKVKSHAETDTKEDWTIEGWLGFNYKSYLPEILSVIRADDFGDLRAANAQELAAGKLTTPQITQLKKQLRLGFSNGENMREITQRIKKNVKAGDLFKLTDGKKTDVLQVGETARARMIARTEITRLSNEGAIKKFEKDEVPQYRWIAAGDADAVCADLNGNIFKVGEGPTPPAHIGCRCRVIPVTEELEK